MRMSAIVLAAAALGCAAARPAPGSAVGPQSPVPDAALGLSRGSVFDVPVPPPVPANASTPGEGSPAPRAYPGAPPVVPHAVADFLPITARENSCIDCHGVKERKAGEVTPIPPSHLVDLRRAPGGSSEVAGTRYVCTACHVERTGARPLVGNRFGR